MHIRRRATLPILVAAAALVLGACGGDGPASQPAVSEDGHGDHQMLEVSAREFEFTPADLRVSAGEEVMLVLRNAGTIEHDFVIDDPAVSVHADVGQTVEEMIGTFEAGEYTVYCSIPGHREAGMEAILTAED